MLQYLLHFNIKPSRPLILALPLRPSPFSLPTSPLGWVRDETTTAPPADRWQWHVLYAVRVTSTTPTRLPAVVSDFRSSRGVFACMLVLCALCMPGCVSKQVRVRTRTRSSSSIHVTVDTSTCLLRVYTLPYGP
jgi:hypothetical protein